MGFKDMLLRLPPVTKNLLIINIIIWIAMAMVRPVSALLESYGALYYLNGDHYLLYLSNH